MIFTNRQEAGRSLAWRLDKYVNRDDVVVLGIPRGGVPVAYEIAKSLHVSLDVFLLRKLGVPGHEELAFGAIASGGVRVIDSGTLRALLITPKDVEAVTNREQQELLRRETAYRGDRPPVSVTGKTVILVDDGVATGTSLLAGVHALRELSPAKIVIAVPVAPPATCRRLEYEVDELVCVATPERFRAVGEFYDDFSQVSDEQVIELLAKNQEMSVETAT